MNNLRKFNWITQYNSAKEGEELVKPSVSLVIDKAVVIYDEDKPTPPKFMATYDDGRTYKLECDGNTTLTSDNTRPSGYEFSAMTNAVIGDCVTSIGTDAFENCTSLTSCTIGSGVTTIGDGAFVKCSSLTSIDIPSSVTSIGTYAFQGCTSLTSCTIGSGVTSIGDSAFSYCTSLTSCTIGSGVTSIGRWAFSQCSSLTSIDIPNSVRSIGSSAFAKCSGLTSIIVEPVDPPTLEILVFYGSTCPIYVPDVETYKVAEGWSDYASRLKPISEKP